MSKIKAELVAAAALEPKRGEPEAAFLTRLVAAVGNDIADEVWNGISPEAQDWNNAAADALKLSKPFPPFPDEVSAPVTRARAVSAVPVAAPAPYEPKHGDEVTATSKRGKVVTGFVVAIDDGVVIVNAAHDGPEANDVELPIASNLFAPAVPGAATVAGTPAGEPEGPSEPELGDTVEVTT